ncbi:MAG: EutN/CcmL family microcompartment protein [Caldilineaceae bacterium]|nr:EutN/CcmL family microcompartment protein [Caldilineaceae bacterium]
MKIAIVVGTVVASHKEPNLEGSRLLILKNVTVDAQVQSEYVVAVDAVGAGPGEYVLYAGGSSARQTAATHNRPVDSVVMAIVDSWEVDGVERYRKG